MNTEFNPKVQQCSSLDFQRTIGFGFLSIPKLENHQVLLISKTIKKWWF
jgi:hypothetical protein